MKNGNFDLALRKRLFCNAKPTLLPCKTAAFGMQNNRFCKALIYRLLRNSYACEKYLHYFCPFPTYMTRCANEAEQGAKARLQPPKPSVSRMERWLFICSYQHNAPYFCNSDTSVLPIFIAATMIVLLNLQMLLPSFSFYHRSRHTMMHLC